MDENHQEFHILDQVSFSLLINIPYSWLEYVRFLEGYKPRIRCTVVCYKLPSLGKYKYRSNKALKSYLIPSSCSFIIRDNLGNLVHAEGIRIDDTNNLVVELMALRMVL